jgi:Holliday junction DNA helicase RuvB
MMFHLEFYSSGELKTIIKRSAKLLSIDIDDEGAGAIAVRSRGTPRIANRLLRRVRDWVDVKSDGHITNDAAEKALAMHGIDRIGLDRIDRRMLNIMYSSYQGGPVGIEAIASSLNEEVDTIEDVVEPYLLKIGFIKRTPRGRELTDEAFKYLGKNMDVQKDMFGPF